MRITFVHSNNFCIFYFTLIFLLLLLEFCEQPLSGLQLWIVHRRTVMQRNQYFEIKKLIEHV